MYDHFEMYLFLLGHDGAITSVGWSHDNNWLVSSSEDRTLKIWSVSSAEPALCLVSFLSEIDLEYSVFHLTTKNILITYI